MKFCVGMCVGGFRTGGSGKQQWTLEEPWAGMADGAQYQEDASSYPGRATTTEKTGWSRGSQPVVHEPFGGSNNPFTGATQDHWKIQIFTL